MIADSDSKKRMEAAGSSEGLRVLLGELAAGVATEFWHHFIICLIVHLIPEPRSPFPFRDLLEGRDLLLQLLALGILSLSARELLVGGLHTALVHERR